MQPAVNGQKAIFHFHGDLRELVSRRNEEGVVAYPAGRAASVKDVVESLGVPHSEVYGIEAGGIACDFAAPLAPGVSYDVFGALAPVDVKTPTRLRPVAFSRLAFIADANVGALARLLVTLGLDCDWAGEAPDREIAARSKEQERVVLTRDKGLLKRSAVVWGRLVRNQKPELQLLEILELFGLSGPFAAFSRCVRCNLPLLPVAKEDVLHLLEPLTKKHFHDFTRCAGCNRVYWPGSHHDGMRAALAELGIPLA